jgi:hypothetical protein
MDFKLLLFQGTDIIKFGMSSIEIQSILKIKPVLFKKSEFDLYDTEDYNGICHVYYETGKNGTLICAAVEFFKPSQVFLDSIQLIGERKEKIQDLFNTKFEDCVSDTSGAGSKKFDIAFYSPRKTVESVFIARKGYCFEQEEFYKKMFAEKYSAQDEIEDITIRKRLCPSCITIATAKEGAVCPQCNVLLI